MSGKAQKGLMLTGIVLALVALALPKIGLLPGAAKNKNATAAAPRDARLAVRTEVLQAEKLGDRIGFTVQGSAKKFSGNVYALEAKIDPTTRTLHLRALNPNPDGALIPGAYANVEVVMQEKETLMIPSFALIPELKGQRVFLYKNGKAESQPVEIGIRTDERLEVTAGVQTGDTLITSAILQLRAGMPMRLAE